VDREREGEREKERDRERVRKRVRNRERREKVWRKRDMEEESSTSLKVKDAIIVKGKKPGSLSRRKEHFFLLPTKAMERGFEEDYSTIWASV
jgi:hypothetical protein